MFIRAKHIYFNGSLMWHDKETFSLLIYQFVNLVITAARLRLHPFHFVCELDTSTMHTAYIWVATKRFFSFISFRGCLRLGCRVYNLWNFNMCDNKKQQTMNLKAALCCRHSFSVRVLYRILKFTTLMVWMKFWKWIRVVMDAEIRDLGSRMYAGILSSWNNVPLIPRLETRSKNCLGSCKS